MPPVDLLEWCIDVLASRYGWTRHYVLEELYWEEFWGHTQIAANYEADERNSEFRFHFMLHADKKSAGKWKDLPLPFPQDQAKSLKDKSGVKQLPSHLQGLVSVQKD